MLAINVLLLSKMGIVSHGKILYIISPKILLSCKGPPLLLPCFHTKLEAILVRVSRCCKQHSRGKVVFRVVWKQSWWASLILSQIVAAAEMNYVTVHSYHKITWCKQLFAKLIVDQSYQPLYENEEDSQQASSFRQLLSIHYKNWDF